MGARVTLDSSVLIALLNPDDLHHQKWYEAVSLKNLWLQISALSLAEALVVPHRLGKEIAKKREKQILDLVDEVVPVNSEISLRAARLRSQTSMRLIDAVISSTAEITKTELWTSDLKQARFAKGARSL